MPIKEVRILRRTQGQAGWKGGSEEAEERECTSLWWSQEEHTWASSRNLELLSVEAEKPGKVTREEGAPGYLKGAFSYSSSRSAGGLQMTLIEKGWYNQVCLLEKIDFHSNLRNGVKRPRIAEAGDAWMENSYSRDGGGLDGSCGGKKEKRILNSTFLHHSSGFWQERPLVGRKMPSPADFIPLPASSILELQK